MEKYTTKVKPLELLNPVAEYIMSSGVDLERFAPFITKELSDRLSRPALEYFKEYKAKNSAVSCKTAI